MSQPCYHPSVEGAQHGAKSLAQFLDYARKSGAAGTAENGALEASAKVALSSSAALSGANEASFDQAKVERISQAIHDGQFKINAGVIADKLIANAQELLGRGSR
mgnify:CR=1 FL=1